MVPLILDALTIFFIVASLALLWVNLRAWRRRSAPVAMPKHVGMSHAPIVAPPGDEAEECLKHAEQAASQLDKEAWLRMADQWTELVQDERTVEAVSKKASASRR